MEDSSKICRSSSNLQDSGPSQLSIDDMRWNNIEGENLNTRGLNQPPLGQVMEMFKI